MRNFVIVVVFGLLTIGFFAGFSNFGIPRIEPSSPPPEAEQVDLGTMSVEELVAFGGRLFEGKGTCTLCHNPVGERAPLLDDISRVIEARLAEPGYEGEAGDIESYLRESMVDPSAYVVAGFGKAGTDDTVSPMPNVLTGSIGLSEAEATAVIAYLQASSGAEVTVEIAAEEVAEAESAQSEEVARAPLETPEEAVMEFVCGACHKVAGAEGEIGPDLTGIGAKRDRAYLRRAILDPNADIPEGFEPDMMPPDYGTQLYASELEMLVEYLASLE
ncbi:MAG: c-type cytochrome [Alphaproteobacteria bacterium]|jgi:cytochrome c5|nr:c-type cytochrome [Alphaproteobacteria bacterium]MDP6515386.1 c-type cytochrome [Alphaproteobacteria bacterium]